MELNRLLTIYKEKDVAAICKELTGYDLTERGLRAKDIEKNWKYVGGNESNGSVINMLKKGEKGLIERITNGIDAVIEKQVAEKRMGTPASAKAVIKKAFPRYYQNLEKIKIGQAQKLGYKDAKNQVMVAVSDSSRSLRPTFDVVDHGTGIEGKDFASTILSINKGNKLSSDKKYLIGAFGQGGSTSLSFASSTIIISKKNGKYWFTIVKAVDLEDLKNIVYVYLTVEGEIPEATEDDTVYGEEWINNYIHQDSGTFVRMVEMEVSSDISRLDAAKPRSLNDFINTELFDVGLPVEVYENRANFTSNVHSQDRTVYGSANKLLTWSYCKKDYSGSFVIDFENKPYRVNYYAILPNEEEKWGNDKACEGVYLQLNAHGDPIAYTVNGQMVCTESFTKLKNRGLSQLNHRLLVVIDLDLLGKEKYKFFTTDRSQIRVTDSSKGLLDEVVDKVCKEERLIKLNALIANIAIEQSLDNESVSKIANEVKSEYSKFLTNGGLVKITHSGGTHRPHPPVDYADHIVNLILAETNMKFFKDEEAVFIVNTGADKYVNEREKVYAYVDGKQSNAFVPSFYKGAIFFKSPAKDLGIGKHTISFAYYGGAEPMDTATLDFEVLDQNAPEHMETKKAKALDLKILRKPGAELIIDIIKQEDTGVTVYYNNEHDLLFNTVYGIAARGNSSALKELTDKYLARLVLFTLYQGDAYESLPTVEVKNNLAANFIRSQLISSKE